MHIIWNACFYLYCFFHWICAASVQLFSTVETPSCCLASRERIYKTSDVAGPASAISSLSHKLKGGYACQHSKVIQIFTFKMFFGFFFPSIHFHFIRLIKYCFECKHSSLVFVGSLFDITIQCCLPELQQFCDTGSSYLFLLCKQKGDC